VSEDGNTTTYIITDNVDDNTVGAIGDGILEYLYNSLSQHRAK